MSRGKVMSEASKKQLAYELGFGEKTEDGKWDDVTTGEVGSIVALAIKKGEQKLQEEARLNGLAHQDEL